METTSLKNWRKIVSRGKYPLLLFYELNQGLLNTHKIIGMRVPMRRYMRFSDTSYIFEEEARIAVVSIRQTLNKNPQKAFVWLKRYQKEISKLIEWIEQLPQSLQNADLEKLKKLYQQYEKQIQIVWRWAYLPYLIDDAIEQEINESVNLLKINKRPSDLIRFFGEPIGFTYHQQEQIELLKIAARIKKTNFKKQNRAIEKHHLKWAWKNSWLYNFRPFTIDALKKEIKNLIQKNPEKILKQIKIAKKAKNLERTRLLIKIKNRRIKNMADILSQYALWHSRKIEELTMLNFKIMPLMRQLAQEFHLPTEQFLEMTPDEVLNGKIDLKVLNSRIKNTNFVFSNGKRRLLSKSEIKKFQKEEVSKPKIKILTGLGAYSGKERGRVFVMRHVKIELFKKFKKGNILVTSMTTTDMTPLVQKAAAIVTDEGGILCHAAIISRELKKPCIIGTKIATRVLRNGDLVEVDANRGYVVRL